MHSSTLAFHFASPVQEISAIITNEQGVYVMHVVLQIFNKKYLHQEPVIIHKVFRSHLSALLVSDSIKKSLLKHKQQIPESSVG